MQSFAQTSLAPSPARAGSDAAATPASHEPTGRALDFFARAQAAVDARRARHGDHGIFARTRQLLPTGAWRGPRDAADAYVEEADLAALGGLARAIDEGARTLILSPTFDADLLARAAAANLRCLARVAFQTGEGAAERTARTAGVVSALGTGARIDGVIPTPVSEPHGLDTLAFFAACRADLDVAHVIADFATLGQRLAQMSLGFGADELFGPIVSERALRLGANANNPSMTRKEAIALLRGAGLSARERISGGALEDVTS